MILLFRASIGPAVDKLRGEGQQEDQSKGEERVHHATSKMIPPMMLPMSIVAA